MLAVQVKDVLQKSKLVQFEGSLQMNWNNVLKDYVKNFDDISKDGGWEVIFGEDATDEVSTFAARAVRYPSSLLMGGVGIACVDMCRHLDCSLTMLCKKESKASTSDVCFEIWVQSCCKICLTRFRVSGG